MFHLRLLELESELLAKEQSERGLRLPPPECEVLLQYVEKLIGVHLADAVPSDWRGWLAYRRQAPALVICRGRAFRNGGLFGRWKAGLDVAYGLDTITEYERGFDVTPPQDLDHLFLTFGVEEKPQIFLWYGENLAEYKLIYTADVQEMPQQELSQAVVDCCVWILTRPKEKTLLEFLREIEESQEEAGQEFRG